MSPYPSTVTKPIQETFTSSPALRTPFVTKKGLKELAQELRMDVQVALRVAHLMLGLKGIRVFQPRRNDKK